MIGKNPADCWHRRYIIKITIGLAALWLTLGSFLVWDTGRLSPWLSIASFAAVVTVVIAASLHSESLESTFQIYLVLLVVVAIFYSVLPMLFTSSLIGVDPNWYTIQAQAVIETGHTDAIASPIYRDLSAYIIGLAIFSEIMRLSVERVSVILPIAGGIILPLATAIITLQLCDDRYTALLAAGFIAISPSIVKFTYAPIPQSLGVLLFSVFFIVLLQYYQSTDKITNRRTAFLLFGIAAVLAYTHKLPLFVISMILISIFAISKVGLFDLPQSQSMLFLYCSVLLFSVWTFITDFFSKLALRVQLILLTGLDPYTTFLDPNAATRTKDGLQYIVGRNLHWLVLSLTAGVGWLLIAKRLYSGSASQPRQNQSGIVLLCAAIMMGLLAVGLLGSAAAFNPVRVAHLNTFLIAVLAAVPIGVIMNQQRRHKLAIVLAVIVLATQAFAIGVLPDDTNAPRSYLTESEYEGKQFMSSHVPGIIYTDTYYVRAGLNTSDPVSGYWRTHAGKYRTYDDAVFNGSFNPISPENVAYRTNVDIYGHTSFGGYWALEWNPKAKLDACGNQVYTAGDVLLYDTSKCWNR